MRRMMVGAMLVLAGCGSELIEPEDPRYEDQCVIYVGESQGAEITRSIFDRCETIEIQVV